MTQRRGLGIDGAIQKSKDRADYLASCVTTVGLLSIKRSNPLGRLSETRELGSAAEGPKGEEALKTDSFSLAQHCSALSDLTVAGGAVAFGLAACAYVADKPALEPLLSSGAGRLLWSCAESEQSRNA